MCVLHVCVHMCVCYLCVLFVCVHVCVICVSGNWYTCVLCACVCLLQADVRMCTYELVRE